MIQLNSSKSAFLNLKRSFPLRSIFCIQICAPRIVQYSQLTMRHLCSQEKTNIERTSRTVIEETGNRSGKSDSPDDDLFRIMDLNVNSVKTNDLSEEKMSSSTDLGNNVKQPGKSESSGKTAEAIALATKHYTQELNRAYSDLERVLMARIHESNKRRFRVILFSVTVALAWIIVIFGGNIRKKLTDETAELARETLENESLKVQTKELATAVVQTILNDKDVMKHAAEFLRDASGAAETQAALLSLTLHVLQHPQSLQELTILVKKVLAILTSDKETIDQLARLLSSALQEPLLQVQVSRLVQNLARDPEVLQALFEAVQLVLQQPEVQGATTSLLSAASQEVLDDRQVEALVRIATRLKQALMFVLLALGLQISCRVLAL